MSSYEARTRPKLGKEGRVQAARQGYRDWVSGPPGLLRLFFVRDIESGQLVGSSVWNRKEILETATHLTMRASGAEASNRMAGNLTSAMPVPFDAHMYEALWEQARG